MLLVGLPVALLSWYVGVYLVSRVIARRVYVALPDLIFGGAANGGRDGTGVDG